MTFGAVWALVGLVLLAPLVVLHLRQRSGRMREVPSLLLWHEFQLDAPGRARRLGPPPLPLLLALQALALSLLVLALAEPRLGSAELRPATVVVLDDSFWMTAPGALTDAKGEVDAAMRSLPASTQVRIVLADGTPAVLYRGPASGAAAVVAGVRAGAAPDDLSRGLAVAAGVLTGPRDRVVLVRAPEDGVPALWTSSGELRTLVAGHPAPDLGIFDATARCGIGAPATCEVLATLANTNRSAEAVRVIADASGQSTRRLSARVGAHASVHIRLLTAPGEHVSLRLSGSDAVSMDNDAWVTVPGDDNIPRPASVTIVGRPADARSLAQAFAAVPGVSLRLETPTDYRPSVARASDLVVLDGTLPHGALPPAPAVMLVDPAQVPGGLVQGLQVDPTLSGFDPSSPLLQDADLTSLTIARGAARRLILPRWLAPVLWSPSGPLLAAGDNGRRRLIVTAFQPAGSTLGQLAAFPVLAANLVRWSLDWTPGSATAGSPFNADALPGARVAVLARNGVSVDRVGLGAAAAALHAATPGAYTLRESGPGVSHQVSIDVNLSSPASPSVPVDIRTSQVRASRRPPAALAPWLLLAALIVIGIEWILWSRSSAPTPVSA